MQHEQSYLTISLIKAFKIESGYQILGFERMEWKKTNPAIGTNIWKIENGYNFPRKLKILH